jgi:hypothetical protein
MPAVIMCAALAVLATISFAHSSLSETGKRKVTYASPLTPSTSLSPQSNLTASSPSANNSKLAIASSSPSFTGPSPSPVKISLAQLCDSPGAVNVYICGQSYGGTVQVGSRLFTYYGENNGFASAQPPNWDLVLQFSANTCTYMKMQFATEDSSSTAYLQVVQTTLRPVTSTAQKGTIGTLTAKLDGGPFELQADSSDGSQVFVNGYAICTSPSAQ